MSKKVIIIEDDPDILEIMSFIISAEGYEVLGAKNCEPLDEVHFHQPALILMDNRLPDGFGHDYCRELKNNPATRHYPVVLVSAGMGLERLACDSCADGYLQKPFDIDDLVSLVKNFV